MKNVSKCRLKPLHSYEKVIDVVLTTKAPDKQTAEIVLNDVARSIYSLNNPLVLSQGEGKRDVTMLHESTPTIRK